MNILESNFSKANLEKVSKNIIQMNYEQIKILPGLLYEFEYLFSVNIVKWDTTTVDSEMNHGSKPSN